jgi:hypothetical protein
MCFCKPKASDWYAAVASLHSKTPITRRKRKEAPIVILHRRVNIETKDKKLVASLPHNKDTFPKHHKDQALRECIFAMLMCSEKLTIGVIGEIERNKLILLT